MFTFGTEQKVCEVGGVKFGGQPGEYPTAICSSIFQKGDKVFIPPHDGHTTLNLAPAELKMSNWVADEFQSE